MLGIVVACLPVMPPAAAKIGQLSGMTSSQRPLHGRPGYKKNSSNYGNHSSHISSSMSAESKKKEFRRLDDFGCPFENLGTANEVESMGLEELRGLEEGWTARKPPVDGITVTRTWSSHVSSS